MNFDFYRRIKLLYTIYNYFHKNQLIHNEFNFQKIGLKKRYYSSLSSSDFKSINPNLINSSSAVKPIHETQMFAALNEKQQQHVLEYDHQGYAILESFLSPELVDEINAEVDEKLKNGELAFNEVNKIMFAIGKSKLLRGIAKDEKLIEFLSALCGFEITLFQSINFIKGSQQATHSDTIHMTTFPLGGLLGFWIALEDIEIEQGALHFYPESHKLPYVLNADYDNEGNRFLLGNKSYREYEALIAKKISEHGLQKKIFKAKKGDALIWHANLLHGGEPHTDKSKTRKSVVFHYFNPKSICYHEISQRPALIQKY